MVLIAFFLTFFWKANCYNVHKAKGYGILKGWERGFEKESEEMRYELNLDYYFLELWVLNLCVLKWTNVKLWMAATSRRIHVSAFLGAVMMTVIVILPIGKELKFVMEIMLWAIMLCLAFSIHNMRGLWQTMGSLGRSVLLFGGLLWTLVKIIMHGIPEGFRLPVTLVLGLSLTAIIRIKRKKDEIKGETWKATLVFQGKSIQMGAILDSGNSLYEPISGKAVCVADADAAIKLWGEEVPYRVIPYRCVGKERGIMKAYRLDKLYLEKEGPTILRENVYVAISPQKLENKDGKAGFLIHPAILRGN